MTCTSVNDGVAVSSGEGLSSYWAFTNTTTTCDDASLTLDAIENQTQILSFGTAVIAALVSALVVAKLWK